jgi:hypothetical protein
MDADQFDRLTKTLIPVNTSRRTLLAGVAATLLSLLGDAVAVTAVKRKGKRQRKKCPRPRRCDRRCCTRSQECCKGVCRRKCPPGTLRNRQTCRCDACLLEGTAGDGPLCTSNNQCCSGICGPIRGGVIGTCRRAICTPPGGE